MALPSQDKTILCPLATEADVLTQFLTLLPLGEAYKSKNIENTNVFTLFKGLATETAREKNQINNICNEYNPITTDDYLDEWENALGLPDECFKKETDPIIRRRNILLKLVGLWVMTKEDYIELAAILGFTITITYPLKEDNTPFIVFVNIFTDESTETFPYEFPFLFGGLDPFNILICLFNKLKPVHIKFTFRVNPPNNFRIIPNGDIRVIPNGEARIVPQD